MACFKAISADGVSFAIPIDTAKDVIQQLQQRGRVIRPYIGIKMLQLNQHNAAQMRQKDPNFPEVMQGILVPFVAANSPAAKCGLREGDVITGVCAAHSCMLDFSQAVASHAYIVFACKPSSKELPNGSTQHACLVCMMCGRLGSGGLGFGSVPRIFTLQVFSACRFCWAEP